MTPIHNNVKKIALIALTSTIFVISYTNSYSYNLTINDTALGNQLNCFGNTSQPGVGITLNIDGINNSFNNPSEYSQMDINYVKLVTSGCLANTQSPTPVIPPLPDIDITPPPTDADTSDCGLEFSNNIDPICETWLPRDRPDLHVFSIPAAIDPFNTGPLPIDDIISTARWHIIGCGDLPQSSWIDCYQSGTTMFHNHIYSYRLPFRTGINTSDFNISWLQVQGVGTQENTKQSSVIALSPDSKTPVDNQVGCTAGELNATLSGFVTGSKYLKFNQVDMHPSAVTRCNLQPNTTYYINVWVDGVYTSTTTNSDGVPFNTNPVNQDPLVLDMANCGVNTSSNGTYCRVYGNTSHSWDGSNIYLDYSRNPLLPNYINTP